METNHEMIETPERAESELSSVIYINPDHQTLDGESLVDDSITYVILPSDTDHMHPPLPFTHHAMDGLNMEPQITSLDENSLKDLDTLSAEIQVQPTFVEILVEAESSDSKHNDTDVNGVEVSQPQPDLANPIAINDQSIVVIDGKKCVLRTNPETGQLVAYPTISKTRGPGRPRKETGSLQINNQNTMSQSRLEFSHDGNVRDVIKNVEANNVQKDDDAEYIRPMVVDETDKRMGETVKRKRGRPPKKAPSRNKYPAPVQLVVTPFCSAAELDRLKCERCFQQFYFEHQKNEHIISAHADQVNRCVVCRYATFNAEDLVKHYIELHPKNYCVYCGLTNEKAFIIKRHLMRHTMEGCECEICGKIFKDSYIKKVHIKMIHQPADTLYECNVCQKKFSRRAHLTRHIRIHDSDKAFKCPYCDYRGIEKADVSKHVLVHEEPKFFCEICSKAFRHAKNRDLHIKRHNQQKDYKCGLCEFYGYTFTDIRKHIERTHSESSRLTCGKCSGTFQNLDDYTEHCQSCAAFYRGDVTGTMDADKDSAIRTLIQKDVPSKDLSSDEARIGQNLVMDGEHFPDDHWTMTDVATAHAQEEAEFAGEEVTYDQILGDEEEVGPDASSHMSVQA